METTNNARIKNRNLLLYVTLVALSLSISAIYLNGCKTTAHSDYEKGVELLKDKQYTEALEEFAEVESGDPNYRLAQSKISYIHGLRAFNDSLMSEARTYLVKVESDDEYYHDSQLMIEKIDQSLAYHQNETAMLATKTGTDTTTVVIKEEVVQQTSPPEKKEPVVTDRQINSTHASQLEGIIRRFETSFQSARNAPVTSKSSLLANMRSIEAEFYNLAYRSNDPNVLELRRLMSSWMSKRISFVNQQIAENTVGESESSRQIRADGDNMYYSVNNQLRKVKSIYVD